MCRYLPTQGHKKQWLLWYVLELVRVAMSRGLHLLGGLLEGRNTLEPESLGVQAHRKAGLLHCFYQTIESNMRINENTEIIVHFTHLAVIVVMPHSIARDFLPIQAPCHECSLVVVEQSTRRSGEVWHHCRVSWL